MSGSRFTVDILRQGRWYGGKGNGELVKECLRIVEEIERWQKNKVYEAAKEGLVSGGNKKLGPGTVILTLNAWNELESVFEQLKVKYVKYKIWQDE